MRYLSLSYTCVAISLTLLSLTVAAAPPSTEELKKALTPAPAPAGSKAKMRGLPGAKMRGVEVMTTAIATPPPSVQLQQISFEFNSAKLTPEAQQTLDNLAGVMNDDAFKAFRFKLTGHTDAVGSAEFNLTLSTQRAQSAQAYLSKQHHVDAKRLIIEGKGFSELADSANPESAVNRRVQVTNLGQAE